MKELLDTNIPRRQLFALGLLVTLAAAPHAFHLSALVTGYFILVLVIRLVIYQQRRHMPGKLVKMVLTAAGVACVLATEHTILGKEGGVALLCLMLALKLLEVKARRDLYITIFLTFFLGITQFLFDTAMAQAGYEFLIVVGLTALLVEMNRVHPSASLIAPLREAALLVGQALPLMVILFLLFPRISTPLWDLRLGSSEGRTGLSDRMAPGSVSKLSQSDEVAFRVEFEGEPPPPEQRYWRGPVFSRYDGREWTTGSQPPLKGPDFEQSGAPASYTVTIEPNGQRWLFALDLPGEVPERAEMLADYQLISDNPLEQRRRYTMRSWPNYRTGDLSDRHWEEGLQLPANVTRRMRDLVAGWKAQDPRPTALVQAGLTYFNREGFLYTLEPPLLGNNPADEFLFETRQGFCEHYSSAFVLLMRIAGIPSRVVTGYQGMEFNPMGEYFIVRQSHAHAWAEVYLEGRGWVRADPTIAVAPERVVRSINPNLVGEDGAVVFEGTGGALLTDLMLRARLALDAANSGWNQWVLGYSQNKQRSLLAELGFPKLELQNLIFAMIGLVFALLFGAAWWFTRHTGPAPDPARRLYDRFCRRLARRGLARRPTEGAQDFARRAGMRFPPLAGAVKRITAAYIAARYGKGGNLKELQRLVQGFRP